MMILKQDKGVQTDPCLSLEIGDKILEESSISAQSHRQRGGKDCLNFTNLFEFHSPINSASLTTL